MLKIRNLDYLRNADPATSGTGYGARLFEALQDLNNAVSNHIMQTNGNPTGEPQAPPALDSIKVTSTTTGHHVSLTHNADVYRGIEYHAVYADNPQFTNAFPVYMGPSREADVATGSKSLYFGAFPQYPTGKPGPIVYHGGNRPIAVQGGMESPLGTSQGSGTGAAGVAHSGHGPVQFRSSTGKLPTR
jgi:hypothetical protein